MTVINETLINQQITKATDTAEKLAQWLDAARRFQSEQAKQKALQAQVEKARRGVASLEATHAQILLTATDGFVPVDIQEAAAELNDAILVKTIKGLFQPMLGENATGDNSPLNDLFSEVLTDETSIMEPDTKPSEDDLLMTDELTLDIGDMPDFDESMWDDATGSGDVPDAPPNLTDVFALPDDNTPASTLDDTATIDSLLNAEDPAWMQHLETLSADEDTTTNEDLELLFKDIEDAPDDGSPWADPWDNKFQAQSGNDISDDLSLPVLAWDAPAEAVATTNAPAAKPKKRGGLLRQWFFRD